MTPRQSELRFSGAPWYKSVKETPVILIGAGGIGSWAALLLSRTGFNVTVYDPDIIEAHNIGGQLYRMNQIGQPKVQALAEIVGQFSETRITGYAQLYPKNISAYNAIVILAVDNIRTRREVATAGNFMYLIDGRMTAESHMVYTISCVGGYRMIREYLNTLPEDEDAISDGPCSMRATSFNGAAIASTITAVAVNILAPYRTVPFMTRMDFPMFNHKIEL